MTGLALVINPVARSGRAGRMLPDVHARALALWGELPVLSTTPELSARVLARRWVEQGGTHLLSLGGDGTHSQVAAGVADAGAVAGEVRLSPLPMGSGGDLCRLLAMGRNMDRALELAADPEAWCRVDLGAWEMQDADGHPMSGWFLNVAGFGMSGLVDRFANRSAKRFGSTAAFAGASLRAWWMWQPARVRCRIDGHDVWEGSLNNVFIANGRYQGAGMRVAPGALMDDGRLDVAILPSLPLAETLPMLPGLYRGTWQEHPAVHVSQGSEVEITVLSGQIFADIDGEDGGRGSARVRCLPRALGLTGVPGWAREVGG